MRKAEWIVLGFVLWISLFYGGTLAKAAPRPLTDLGYFHWADQAVTPAENTFIMHYGEETTVVPLEGEVHSGYLEVNRSTKKSKVLIKNVGFYEGQAVSLLVTLERNKSNLDGGSLSFTKSYFLGIDITGEMIVTYDFLDSAGNPLALKTAFNYFGLNTNKYIGYENPGTVVESLYANNPTHILYDTWDDGGDSYWLYLKNQTPGIPWRDLRQSFEMTTKKISHLTFVVHNNDVTPSSIVYVTDFLAKPEFSPAYGSNTTFAQADQGVYLAAKQTIPSVDKWKTSTEMAVTFNLRSVSQTQQYTPRKVEVTNFKGEDLTELFTSRIAANGDVTVAANNLADPRLDDTVLQYKVYLTWQGNERPVDPTLISRGVLQLPFQVATSLDGRSLGEKNGVSTVNYTGSLKVSFLDETNQKLHEPIEKTGIVTTAFDLTDVYPAISGYEPLKDPSSDQGRFQPGKQEIVHRYRKERPLQFELTDPVGPLVVSRFTHRGTFSVAFSHEDSTNVTLMAKCGTDEQVIKKYPTAPEKVTDQVDYRFPTAWLDQEVAFFIKDDHDQRSTSATRVVQQEAGPQLILPTGFDFGEISIPAADTTIALKKPAVLQIEDSSRFDPSHWKLKVREEKPLTDDHSDSLSQRLKLEIPQQQVTFISGTDQTIWAGEGSGQLDLADYLRLTLFPSDKLGRYQGVLRWTLEDAPS